MSKSGDRGCALGPLATLVGWKRTARSPAGRRRRLRVCGEGDGTATRRAPCAGRASAADAEHDRPTLRRARRGGRSRSTRATPGTTTATATSSTPATTRTRTPTRARASGRSVGIVGAGAGRDRARRRARAGGLAGRRRRVAGSRAARAVPRARSRASRAFAEANALVDDVELMFLAVPDDVVEPLAGGAPPVRRPGDRPHQRRCSARRCSRRRWPPGTQAGAFHPLVAFADLDRALAALRGRDDRDRGRRRAGRAPRRDGRGDRRRAGPPARRGRRPPTTRPRCSRRAASSRCSTRSRGRRGRRASTRRVRSRIYLPLLRQTLGQRASARDRARPHRPAARGDAGTIEAHLAALRAGAPGRPGPLPRAARARARRSPAGRGAAVHRKSAERLRSRTCRPTRDAVRCRECSTASPARHAAWPARVRPSRRPGHASGDSASAAVVARSSPRPARRTVLRRPRRRAADRAAARRGARSTIAPGASRSRSGRPAARVARCAWTSSTAVGGPRPLVRGAGVARLRQATATSAGGIVIRFSRRDARARRRQRRRERDGVTWTLPKGTPDADETTEQTALREVREETGLEVRIVAPVRLASSTGSSRAGRASTRPCTTS